MSDIDQITNFHTPSPNKKALFCKKAVKFVFSRVGLTAMVLGYATVGALVFRAVESENEKANCHSLLEKYEPLENKTKHNVWTMMKTFAEKDLADLETRDLLLNEFKTQLRSWRNVSLSLGYGGINCSQIGTNSSVPEKWSFGGAFLFSITIMTTIGYGNISPETKWGRMIVIAYALLGIPIMLLCLTNIGEVLADMFKFVYVKICCCGCARKRRLPGDSDDIHMIADDDDEDDDDDYQSTHIPLTVTMAMIALFLLLGACIFSVWEGWHLVEAAYYSYVTVSTIGFGDFVPGTEMDTAEEVAQTVFASVYMLLGMALLSMCFTLIHEEVAVKLKLLAGKLGFTKLEQPATQEQEGEAVEEETKKTKQKRTEDATKKIRGDNEVYTISKTNCASQDEPQSEEANIRKRNVKVA